MGSAIVKIMPQSWQQLQITCHITAQFWTQRRRPLTHENNSERCLTSQKQLICQRRGTRGWFSNCTQTLTISASFVVTHHSHASRTCAFIARRMRRNETQMRAPTIVGPARIPAWKGKEPRHQAILRHESYCLFYFMLNAILNLTRSVAINHSTNQQIGTRSFNRQSPGVEQDFFLYFTIRVFKVRGINSVDFSKSQQCTAATWRLFYEFMNLRMENYCNRYLAKTERQAEQKSGSTLITTYASRSLNLSPAVSQS